MANIIQLRRDTAANWTAANPILAQGEIGIETDTLKVKCGDGTSSWSTLNYLIDTGDYLTSTDVGTIAAQNANNVNITGGQITASVNLSGSVLPTSTDVFDIGSDNLRFKDLYLSGSTIFLGDLRLSSTDQGKLSVRNALGNPVVIDATASFSELSNVAGREDIFISASFTSPYSITSSDINKRLVSTSEFGGIIFDNTSGIPTGSKIGLIAKDGPVVIQDGQLYGGSFQTSTFLPVTSSASLVRAITPIPDGKIFIGGTFTTIESITGGGASRLRLAKLNFDGSLDSTFRLDASSDVNTILLAPDGELLVGGAFTTLGGVTRNRFAKINSNGIINSDFNLNANNTINNMVFDSDGKLLVVGAFTSISGVSRERIARFNTDGTIDTGFNVAINGTVNKVVVESNGTILIGGDFTTVGGFTRNRIARLESNGVVDSGFNPNAGATVVDIVVESSGTILVAGAFTTIGGQTRNRFARLNSNGTAAAGHSDVNSTVNRIAVLSNGQIAIGGVFTTVGDTARNRIAILESNLSLGQLNLDANNNINGMINYGPLLMVGGSVTIIDGSSKPAVYIRYIQDTTTTTDSLIKRTPNVLPRYTNVEFEKVADGRWIMSQVNIPN